MYVKKSEYARTVKRNEELEDQAICQYDLIKKLLKENASLKKELDKYKKQYEHSMGEDDELIYEEGLYD